MRFSTMAISNLKLLWDAITIPIKNWKLFLPLILLSLLSSSLLFFTNYLSISPILLRISINLHVLHVSGTDTPRHPVLISAIKKDLRHLLFIEALFVVLIFAISSFLRTSVVRATSQVSSIRKVSEPELHAVTGKSWKAPVLTQLLVSVLDLCCMFILTILANRSKSLYYEQSIILFVVVGGLTLLSFCLYVRLAMAWAMSIIVSVVEEGCWGLTAISKAAELIQGKKKQAVAASVLYAMATCAFYGAYSFSTVFVPPITGSPLANGITAVAASTAVSMLVLAAYTVLYYECRRGHGEEDMELKGSYA